MLTRCRKVLLAPDPSPVVAEDAGIAKCGLNRSGTGRVRVGCSSKTGFKWLLGTTTFFGIIVHPLGVHLLVLQWLVAVPFLRAPALRY